jgi:hypothetical protein
VQAPHRVLGRVSLTDRSLEAGAELAQVLRERRRRHLARRQPLLCGIPLSVRLADPVEEVADVRRGKVAHPRGAESLLTVGDRVGLDAPRVLLAGEAGEPGVRPLVEADVAEHPVGAPGDLAAPGVGRPFGFLPVLTDRLADQLAVVTDDDVVERRARAASRLGRVSERRPGPTQLATS